MLVADRALGFSMLYHPYLPLISPSAREDTRPNWAEISTSNLAHNFRTVQKHLGAGVTICAVVKCDAYGHGAEGCASALEGAGATWFGVTSTDEGVRLRDAGIRSRILVMTGAWRGEEEDILRYSLTPAVFRIEDCEVLVRAAARIGMRQDIAVHLKVDTGMARLGLPMGEVDDFAERLKRQPQIALEGLFSHLASAEVTDAEDARLQAVRFGLAARMLDAHGLHPRLRHLANSAAMVARPETWHSMVRPGVALYGYGLPVAHVDGSPVADAPKLPLKPALSWRARVINLRDVPPGQPLGYNGTYITPAAARIATVPVGYGDGFSRRMSYGLAKVKTNDLVPAVLVRGRRAPIVGRISMDLTLIDVSHIGGVQLGDAVTLIGRDKDESISAWDHADWSDTVVYETLCNLSERVPRRFVE
jgi:alanine racemase